MVNKELLKQAFVTQAFPEVLKQVSWHEQSVRMLESIREQK